MGEAAEDIKEGTDGLVRSLGRFLKGVFRFILWSSIVEFYKVFARAFSKSISKTPFDYTGFFSVITAAAIVLFLIVYEVVGLYEDLHHWIFIDRYTAAEEELYETDVENFFKKYNEKYMERDCGFMREVGADEAMWDKWGHSSYPDDYSCEAFVDFQEKQYLPIQIDPIETNGSRYRVTGQMMIVGRNQGLPLYVGAQYFELWKEDGWDTWHFNVPKDGPQKIETQSFPE